MQEVHECTDTSGPTVQVGPSTGVVSQPVRPPAKTSREKNTPVWEQKAEINVSLITSPFNLGVLYVMGLSSERPDWRVNHMGQIMAFFLYGLVCLVDYSAETETDYTLLMAARRLFSKSKSVTWRPISTTLPV